MITRFSNWLSEFSNGWVTLIGLLIFIAFSILVLPAQSAKFDQVSQDVSTPDLSLYYTADDLYRAAEAYGETGRQEFIKARYTFDIIWPLVYTFFLTTAISWLLKRSLHPNSCWRSLNLLPLAAMLVDFLENSANSLVMARFPDRTPVVDVLAGPITSLKWLLVGGSFLALVAGLVIFLFQGRQKK